MRFEVVLFNGIEGRKSPNCFASRQLRMSVEHHNSALMCLRYSLTAMSA
jgi:hypothetical protein